MEVLAVESPDGKRRVCWFWLRFGAKYLDGIIIGIPTGIISVFISIFFEWRVMELEE